MSYYDVETLVQKWLLATPLADKTRRTDGGSSIFKAMPLSAPKRAIVLTRVGGSPRRRVDMPDDAARISFDCWGDSRTYAVDLAITLTWQIEELGPTGGFTDGTARLAVAETLSVVWLPDKNSDTPRYVVDGLFDVIPA